MFGNSIGLIQGEGKAGALTRFAFDKGLLVVSLQDVFDDGQAKARTPVLARPAFVCTVKALKDPGEVLIVDTHPVVPDFN